MGEGTVASEQEAGGRSAVGATEGTRLSRRTVLLFAVATGCSVANLYYIQPLLPLVRHDLHASTGEAALAAALTQFGYVVGLVLVLPLGDMLERRRLIPLTTLALAAALVLAGAAPNLAALLVGLTLVGAASVVAQTLVPFAASLAPEHERGRVVGLVMSGLLVGILLARTVSGAIAAVSSWRVVLFGAAGLMALVGAVLARTLPGEAPRARPSYGELLRSLVELLREEPVLRHRAVYGALAFGCFSVLWTSLAFLLAAPPYRYGSDRIGLFGLVGLAGVLMANLSGRLGDRGHIRMLTVVNAVALCVAFAVLFVGRDALGAVVAGIVLLDAGTQGMQVTNQSQIYALRPEHRSRVNSVYMTGYFLGGTAASALVAAIYPFAGWSGICALGGALALVALGLAAADLRSGAPVA